MYIGPFTEWADYFGTFEEITKQFKELVKECAKYQKDNDPCIATET